MVVQSRFAYPLPAGLAPETAAVLMCAGLAVFPPLRRYTQPGDAVGVVGLGGLGHLAVQFAKALGCEVTVLSSSAGKETEARAFGADHFLLSADRTAMEQAEFRFDLLLATAPRGNDWGALLMALKKRGRLVLPAFSPLHLPLAAASGSGPAVDLVVHEVSITGSFLGSCADMRQMLGFAAEHRVVPAVETLPLAQANEALRRVEENRARYRVVLLHE